MAKKISFHCTSVNVYLNTPSGIAHHLGRVFRNRVISAQYGTDDYFDLLTDAKDSGIVYDRLDFGGYRVSVLGHSEDMKYNKGRHERTVRRCDAELFIDTDAVVDGWRIPAFCLRTLRQAVTDDPFVLRRVEMISREFHDLLRTSLPA